MHMCSCDMGVEESNLNPSNMMHASTHVRFGNALGMENLVCNRFEGQSAEFLLAMAELCSLPSETPPHYTSLLCLTGFHVSNAQYRPYL